MIPPGPEFAVPLRAVDQVEVLDRTDLVRLVAVKTVSVDDPYMAGHFPGRTMLPAVFLLEALRQAVMAGLDPARRLELLEVTSARLLSPMAGGDSILLEIVAVPVDDSLRWTVRADCTGRAGVPVATLKVLVGCAGEEQLTPPADRERPARTPVAFGHARIKRLLPVRHPMLLVDQVLTVEPGESLQAEKAVTGGELCYQGLGEDTPTSAYAYPRSLMLESFGQTAALLWRQSTGDRLDGKVLMLAAIRHCRFDGSAHPGDILRHTVRVERLAGDSAIFSGETWAGNHQLAAVGSLVAVCRPQPT